MNALQDARDCRAVPVALVLAGGRVIPPGKDIWTARRAKPAGLLAKFRIIDFALSNAHQLGHPADRRHQPVPQIRTACCGALHKGWGFLRWEMNEFVELLPAQQRIDEESWYRGTADAVYREHRHHPRPPFGLYRRARGRSHLQDEWTIRGCSLLTSSSGAQCTVACIEVPRMEARAFGGDGRRPLEPDPRFRRKAGRSAGDAGQARRRAREHGHLCVQHRVPVQAARRGHAATRHRHTTSARTSSRRSSRCGSPARAPRCSAILCVGAEEEAEPYWRDVGTVDAYWEANIDLTTTTPALDMYDADWPIWTYQEQLPPAKFVFDQDDRRGMAVDSIVSGGCIISGSRVSNSVLFSRVRVPFVLQRRRRGAASRRRGCAPAR